MHCLYISTEIVKASNENYAHIEQEHHMRLWHRLHQWLQLLVVDLEMLLYGYCDQQSTKHRSLQIYLFIIVATIFGIFLGITFSLFIENFRQFLSSTFNISLFPEEIYFLSKMPSEIDPTSIFLISICSIIITIIVSIFPAFKAAKLDPIKSLKYE